MRPLGSRALGSIATLLPTNYRDSIRQKLVYAGLAGRYRPEEIITAQVLLGVVGFAIALGYAVVAHPSTGFALIFLVATPRSGRPTRTPGCRRP